MKCFVFGKVTYLRQVTYEGGASRLYLSVHDGYETMDFSVYEYEKNFKTNELRLNPLFKDILNNNIQEGCYVNILGSCYYNERFKKVVFKPYAIVPVKQEDLEVCSALGFII
jgi:hypothetical protein